MITIKANQKFDEFSELVKILTVNVTEGARPSVIKIIQDEIQSVLHQIRTLNAHSGYMD